jgi:H+/gluconate symporter-like permease
MPTTEAVFGAILVAVLFGAAILFAWAQRATLRRAVHLPEAERRFERRRAFRRLIGCALMMLMAVLIVFQYLLWETYLKGLEPPIAEQDRIYFKLWGYSWVVILVSLLTALFLAAYDALANRAHLLGEYSRIAEERRAMVQRQAERLREES